MIQEWNCTLAKICDHKEECKNVLQATQLKTFPRVNLFCVTAMLFFLNFPQVHVEFFPLQATGRLRQRWSLSRAAVKVFITAELEPSPLTPPDFTLAALPYLPRALPPLASAPCPSLWSCLAWLSTSPVWPAATSHPSPPHAPCPLPPALPFFTPCSGGSGRRPTETRNTEC